MCNGLIELDDRRSTCQHNNMMFSTVACIYNKVKTYVNFPELGHNGQHHDNMKEQLVCKPKDVGPLFLSLMLSNSY